MWYNFPAPVDDGGFFLSVLGNAERGKALIVSASRRVN